MQTGVYKDTNNFLKSTFVVRMGEPFENYKEMVEYALTDSLFGSVEEPSLSPQIQEILSQSDASTGATPLFMSRKICRDTSLGGNDAINCYYQYCENDDVLYPLFKTEYGDGGMGRVYEQNINANQQILYMTFGLPQYNSFTGFFTNAVIPELSRMMNNGGRFTPASLGNLIGTAFVGAVMLPVLPLVFMYNALKKISSVQITKYCDFRPEMALYYRIVNTIIITLGTNMGFAKNGIMSEGLSGQSQSGEVGADIKSPMEKLGDVFGSGEDNSNLPSIFGTAGWDIHRILLKKSWYEGNIKEGLENRKDLSTDQYLMDQREDVNLEEESDRAADDEPQSWTEKLWRGGMAGISALHDAHLYVGFRVEKSVDSSESFSNETGESPVKAALDSKYAAMSNFKHTILNGNLGAGPIGGAIKGLYDFVSGTIGAAGDALGVSGASHLLTGSAKVDIPEVWTGSSWQKNYTFTMNLRSYYGDPVSIFQSNYIPLAMLLAGFLPRATGTNSYTAPFNVRAYCKGQLSVPYGMIDGVNVRRGSDQHGWSHQRLPTSIDVSFTIKDMSPAMYPGLGDRSMFQEVLGESSGFQEYLTTLSGMGLRERLMFYDRLIRHLDISLTTLYNNTLNPLAWGIGLADTTIGRSVGAVIPATGLPQN